MTWQAGGILTPATARRISAVEHGAPGERPCDRWVHVCAWDGHELGSMAYEQVSDHERVCLFHRSPFDAWLEEVRAKTDAVARIRSLESRPPFDGLTIPDISPRPDPDLRTSPH